MDSIWLLGLVSLSFILSQVEIINSSDIFVIPNSYPLFKQCNQSWGKDVMEHDTICQVGCLMTSVAMALNFYKISIDLQTTTPKTLNTWLQDNEGYLQDDELVENVLEKLQNVKYIGHKNLTTSQVVNNLNNGVVTIAHVRNGTHFVLITGYDRPPYEYWAINDPAFNQTVYKTSDIVGYRVFTMK